MPSPTERVKEIEQAGLAVAAIEENLDRLKAEYKAEKDAWKQAISDLKAAAKPLPLFDQEGE